MHQRRGAILRGFQPERGTGRCALLVHLFRRAVADTLARLTHDLVLPIWKSNVSVSLMIDKKAKRYVHGLVRGSLVDLMVLCSALSLRLFGEDITTAARETAAQKKSAAGKPADTGSPVLKAADDDAADAEEPAVDSEYS